MSSVRDKNPPCPTCGSGSWKVGFSRTGLRCYKCKSCGKKFNERYGTPFHRMRARFSEKHILSALLLYVKCPLSSYQVAEIMALNGVRVSPMTIRNWVQRFVSRIAEISREYKIKFTYRRRGALRGGERSKQIKITLFDSKNDVIASYFVPESMKWIERRVK